MCDCRNYNRYNNNRPNRRQTGNVGWINSNSGQLSGLANMETYCQPGYGLRKLKLARNTTLNYPKEGFNL